MPINDYISELEQIRQQHGEVRAIREAIPIRRRIQGDISDLQQQHDRIRGICLNYRRVHDRGLRDTGGSR